MMPKSVYSMIGQVFETAGRIVHVTPSRGVFVLSRDGSFCHDICFTDYSLAGPAGKTVPRLHLNREWAGKRIPLAVASKWKVNPRKSPPESRIELTLLPEEVPSLSMLPDLVAYIEGGGKDGFGLFFPFEIMAITETNLWSKSADDFAKAIQASLRRRSTTQSSQKFGEPR